MRARPGTPSTMRAVQPPVASADPTRSSGGRGTPARRPARPARVAPPPPAHAGGGGGREGIREPPAGAVSTDDLVLEVDPALRPRDQLQHRVQGPRTLGVQVDPVALDGPRAAGAVHGEGELVALGDGRGGRSPRGGEAHPTPSPSVRSIGRSAWITKAMCSSSGTPSSSAPWRTSSRFTPRANALSLSFFFTEETSRSPRLFDGRTSAQATRKPHSSSTANNAFASGVSRGTPQ